LLQLESTIIAIQSGQALFGLILATLLLALLAQYKHRFLGHWALSFLAMAVHFASAAVIVKLVLDDLADPAYLPALAAFSLVMAYLHVIWLIMGAREAVTDRPVRVVWQAALIVLAIIAALLTSIASGLGTVELLPVLPGIVTEWLVRYSLSHVVTGVAFLVTAAMLWRSMHRLNQLSAYLVPLTFGLYGAYMLHLSAANLVLLPGLHLAHTLHMGAIGLVLQVLIGYSIIIWLLEIERRGASLAQSKAVNAEERLIHFHMHDASTGLPNRRQLQDQLSIEVRAAVGKRSRVAVLSIGIHRFQLLNQALGIEQTDKLIRKLIQRLRTAVPPHAMLGRTGERDFLIILPDVGQRDRLNEKTRKLLAECAKPFSQDGNDVFLSVSGGLCFSPDDEIVAVALIRIAQQAQLRAASEGESLIVHQSADEASEPHDLFQLERELRRGVTEGQFVLHFQPLIGIRQRRIIGFETLLRWHHPQRGLLTPGSFLLEAVRLGVLDELEDQILEQALGQLAEWQQDLSLKSVSASVNLSAQRFQQPDLADKLAGMCQRMKVDPADLHLEITESTAMQDFEAGLNTIAKLRAMGCKICLDDFGTGYSSLSHLRRLQVDYVKLDRSFITNLERDPRERDLTRAIVDLIHSLGMTVLAEGVETRQQLGYLLSCRVDVVQGYLLGKPLPIEAWRGALERPELILDQDQESETLTPDS